MMRRTVSMMAVFGLVVAALSVWLPDNRADDWLRLGKAGGDSVAARVRVDDSPLPRTAAGPAPTSYAPVIEKASAGVVNVFSEKLVRTPEVRGQMPFFNDPFFRHFFGDRWGNLPDNWTPQNRRQKSLGSGVIVSRDGYILTNSHVVDGADEVKVALADGKQEYAAKVVGSDPKTDIALLKIDAQDLPALVLADSGALKVGDVVFAIGNPFGVGQTVTMGIVSATGRGVGIVDYEDFIQTDAAINPGNSGGALVDATGRLIGINTAILSRSGGNQGIGFAVPVNLARQMMEQIIDDGKVSRGYLGVTIQDIDEDLRQAFGLEAASGALVNSVVPGGAAAEAGVENGDVIVEFAGRRVGDSRELRLAVAGTPPGREVTLAVMRQGKRVELKARLRELTGDGLAAASGPALLQGVEVEVYDPERHGQLEAPRGGGGLVVTEVAPDAPAARAGLRKGDVIAEINRQPVGSLAAGRRALSAGGERVLLYIWRQGNGLFLVVGD